MCSIVFFGGIVARNAVTLTNADRRRVDRSTALGFHFGILIGFGLFVLDRMLG